MATIEHHSRNQKFIKRGKVMKFKDLPQTAQDALIHYMSVDGAGWAVEDDWTDWKWGEGQPQTLKGRRQVLNDINKFRHRFIECYGEEFFGYAEIPWNELLESVKLDQDYAGEVDFTNVTPKISSKEYKIPTWPAILSEFPEETFQDGWNRFNMYCKLKMIVPVVWYVD